ncbi:FGGY-family carbohydrate kinase [Prochlorococcus marinus]|uniref:FGGY-family carbohydrate kinase n=1 Tax=Prochlorococcus marinus TaxID=1219 RepID=UPI0022B53E86|nr:FGGY-family carbohydrate kinase [Prochlorococcus marinus]
MKEKDLVLGIDLGTSGVRLAIINNNQKLIYSASEHYLKGLEHAKDWSNTCKSLILKIPSEIKSRLIACSIDGTSGTLLGCDYEGNPIGLAIPYYNQCINKYTKLEKLFNKKSSWFYTNSSIARAFHLIDKYGKDILLRHQADWISGWFLDDWSWGEEGNNIRFGLNLMKKSWPNKLKDLGWNKSLPIIVPSGSLIGEIAPSKAKELGLPSSLKIIAGTTDSNASVLATDATSSDGITVLGSTIVIKRFVKHPLKGVGITNHLVGGRWLAGGASNTGCIILKKFFNDQLLAELSRQIDPETNSGLSYLPLTTEGERFPINDPFLRPILEPRPISDSLYLHGILEGLAKIEALGWEKISEVTLDNPKKIITIGGGSRNPQWRRIRERMIGVPIHTCTNQPAEGVARLALKTMS